MQDGKTCNPYQDVIYRACAFFYFLFFCKMFTVAPAVLPTNAGDLLYQVKNLTGECIKRASGMLKQCVIEMA